MIDGKLGVAIHGAGQVAYAHAASWRKNPHVRIVSVSSRKKDSAHRLFDTVGLDGEVGDDFDATWLTNRLDIERILRRNGFRPESTFSLEKKRFFERFGVWLPHRLSSFLDALTNKLCIVVASR